MVKSKVLLGSGKMELWIIATEAQMDTEDFLFVPSSRPQWRDLSRKEIIANGTMIFSAHSNLECAVMLRHEASATYETDASCLSMT